MTKKKAKSKTAGKTKTKEKTTRPRSKKELNPAGVRKDISRMVESHANKMAQAVIDGGENGQLATVKYLFEMAKIYPESTDGSQATEDEECLAKTLLNRLGLPTEPVGRDDEDEAGNDAGTATAAPAAVEKKSDAQRSEQPHSEPDAARDEEKSKDGSVRAETIP